MNTVTDSPDDCRHYHRGNVALPALCFINYTHYFRHMSHLNTGSRANGEKRGGLCRCLRTCLTVPPLNCRTTPKSETYATSPTYRKLRHHQLSLFPPSITTLPTSFSTRGQSTHKELLTPSVTFPHLSIPYVIHPI